MWSLIRKTQQLLKNNTRKSMLCLYFKKQNGVKWTTAHLPWVLWNHYTVSFSACFLYFIFSHKSSTDVSLYTGVISVVQHFKIFLKSVCLKMCLQTYCVSDLKMFLYIHGISDLLIYHLQTKDVQLDSLSLKAGLFSFHLLHLFSLLLANLLFQTFLFV